MLFVRWTPQACFWWRCSAWRLFGAKLGNGVRIRPGAQVTFPWKLTVGDNCWIGDNAVLYNIGAISIGHDSVISQYAYLCSATHDHRDIRFPLIASPITLEPECWVAARAFVGPGVHVGRGSIVGACSVVWTDVPEGIIVAGNPARKIGERQLRS